jgi:leader peptidase (prepilin peptidase) / N-methyltransferase
LRKASANPLDRVIITPLLRQSLLALTLLAVVGASLLASPGADGLLGAFLGALMLAIAVTDAYRYIIPNELTAAALALALLRAGIVGTEAGWAELIWTAGRGFLVALPLWALMVGYRFWRGRDGLGLGDVKLAFVAGAWLSLATVLASIEFATLSALAAYLIAGAIRKRPMKATAFLPFGAFLAPAIWIGWVVEAMLG